MAIALWAFLGACSLSLPCQANGRFPRAQRLIEDPADASHLILTATYGMLVSSDRGESWRYVCEAAYGAADVAADAMTALTPDGALLAGLYSSISRVPEGMCDFQRTLGMTPREGVPDFALAASMPGRVLAIMVTAPEGGVAFNQVYRSDDSGATWAALGQPLPAALNIALTIDIAPSDPERVYVSGIGPVSQAVLLRSDDGGESFERLLAPGPLGPDEQLYIAAVDPRDPDGLYLRTDFWAPEPESGTTLANDALLYSSDGGGSFNELMRAHGKLLGFALSPDGSEVLLGYGDPIEAGGFRFTEAAALGIYRAPAATASFEKRFVSSVNCLSWTEHGVYVCTHEAETGFSLGLFEQTNFDLDQPVELQPLLKLDDVVGPVECEDGSIGAICRNYWRDTCVGWGRTDCVELGTPLGSGGDAGVGGKAGTPELAGAGSDDDTPSDRGGCGCRSQNAGASSYSGLILAVALVTTRWRSARRRSAAQR